MVPVIDHGTLLHEALLAVAAQAEGLNQDGAQPFAFYHWALGMAVPVDRWNAMVEELCDDLLVIHAGVIERRIVPVYCLDYTMARPDREEGHIASARIALTRAG